MFIKVIYLFDAYLVIPLNQRLITYISVTFGLQR